ncbi:RICIN domain-containing protein [Mangrovibacterium lignilyticum]|uniref:RICIN domain-containing protein n=1 Tax=Mangrovibacterium lignilyticum TaxID=2668052 RepID=UPI0013D4CBE7|nr:RICIN domain-containing protein [Mangrovibacterium lignilyticum]
MRKSIFLGFILLLGSGISNAHAQTTADRTVTFNVEGTGISKPVEFGADLAWANEQAFRRNVLFMGLDKIDIVRASFQPTYPLVNGTDLTTEQINDLNYRIWLIDTYVGPDIKLTLNCDHPSVDTWYHDHPERWEQLIQVTAQAFEADGHNVVTVGAFNEPDYGWNQYTNYMDMYYVTERLAANPYFSGVRLSGGNTLSCSEAQGWYDFLTPAGVNEGNTHQLGGTFADFASFYQSVRANGHHATGDELHNIVEAMVGAEYGMQTGIWWADIDYASGELVRAMDGERLAYSEHRDNWTAAAVYRSPEGKTQAFIGSSERQAVTTSYKFVSENKAVFFDGHGPSYEYTMEIPGGAVGSYMNGQTNAERVINITWGEDVQPVIDGNYILINRSNGLAMQVDGTGRKDGENVIAGSYSGTTTQQWTVTPVDSRIGGDFSYFRISPVVSSRYSLDLYGYSLDDGANIDLWTMGNGGNNQWYLDYNADGYFYIRSRESSKCLDVDSNGNLIQNAKDAINSQQWRLIPVGAPIEFDAPDTPANLVGTGNSSSISLNWTASSASDVAGYTIFRAEAAGGEYNTIARNVTTTSYEDLDVQAGVQYYYKIKAVDASLNSSGQTSVVGPLETGATGVCDPSTITPYYQINYGTWTIGTDFTVNAGDVITFGPQPVDGGSWIWNGCGTSGTLREQTVTSTTSCSPTATYTNDCGAESSVTYNVTVIAAQDPTTISVESIVTGTATGPKGSNYGTAVVTIVDDQLNPIAGATVSGTFSGSFSESVAGVTGTDGTVYFQTSAYVKKPTVDFCVDDVVYSSLPYDPAQNQTTCTNPALKSATIGNTKVTGEVSIFPNPVADYLTIKIEGDSGGFNISLVDLSGRILLNRLLSDPLTQVDLSSYLSGVYMLKIKHGASLVRVEKIIKN